MKARASLPSLFFALIALNAPLQASEIRALASGATRDAIEQVLPKFEKSSGDKVDVAWAGSVDIRKKIGADDVYDLVIASRQDIDAFVKDGKVAPESRVDLMKSGMGIAVKSGAPKPDIKTPDGIKAALLSASAIGYSSGPS